MTRINFITGVCVNAIHYIFGFVQKCQNTLDDGSVSTKPEIFLCYLKYFLNLFHSTKTITGVMQVKSPFSCVWEANGLQIDKSIIVSFLFESSMNNYSYLLWSIHGEGHGKVRTLSSLAELGHHPPLLGLAFVNKVDLKKTICLKTHFLNKNSILV